MVYNFSNYSQIDEVWNNSYRTLPPDQAGGPVDRTRMRGARPQNAVADQVTSGYSSMTEDTAMRLAEHEGEVPYILMRTVPELARSIIGAMNAGDTTRAEELGTKLDAINTDHSDQLTMWGTTGNASDSTKADKSMIGALNRTARVIKTGMWKTDSSVLAGLAGVEGGANATSYMDFISYDSPESVAARKNKYVTDFGLSPQSAGFLAVRDDADPKNVARRSVFKPYFDMAAKINDNPLAASKVRAKARLVDQMFKMSDELGLEDHEKVADIIQEFAGSNPVDDKVASLKSLRECLDSYFNKGAGTGYAPSEFARKWQESAQMVAQNVQRTPAGAANAGTVNALSDVTSTADVQKAEALLTALSKNHGYDFFQPTTQALAKRVIGEARNMGIDLLQAGIKNPTEKLAAYAKWIDTGSTADLTPEVREIVQLKSDIESVRNRLGVTSADQKTDPNDPSKYLGPLPNEYSSVEDETMKAIAPGLSAAVARARSNGVSLTPDDVYSTIASSTAPLVLAINQSTTDPDARSQAISKLSDFVYSRLTGKTTDSNGAQIPEAALRNFRDYVNIQIRGTHIVNPEGDVEINAPTPPRLPTLQSPVSGQQANSSALYDELSIVREDPKRFIGDVSDDVAEAVKTYAEQYQRYIDSVERDGGGFNSSHARKRREKTIDEAGTRLFMAAAAKDLKLGPDLTKQVAENAGILSKIMRGQYDTTSRHSTGRNRFISSEDYSSVAKDYERVLALCDGLVTLGEGEAPSSMSYLKRVSLAQDIMGQLAPAYAQLRDVPPALQYRQAGRQKFFAVADKLGSVFSTRARKAFSDYDNTFRFVQGGDAYKKAASNFNDQLRETLDRDLARINPDYRGAVSKEYGLKFGEGFNPDGLLQYMNARYVKAKEREAENTFRIQEAQRTDKPAQVWGEVLRSQMSSDRAMDVVRQAASARVQQLQAKFGDVFNGNSFVVSAMDLARKKLDNAGGQDLTSVVQSLIERMGTQQPYFYMTDESGNPVPMQWAVGKDPMKTRVVPLMADSDDTFLNMITKGADPEVAKRLRSELLTNQSILGARYLDDQKRLKMTMQASDKEKVKAEYRGDSP